MKWRFAPFVILLGGCAVVAPPPAPITGDAVACAAALFSTGSTDPVVLALAAAASPACQGLAEAVIQDIIQKVMVKRAPVPLVRG